MKFSSVAISLTSIVAAHAAFVPSTVTQYRTRTIIKGYLDDLNKELYDDRDPNPDPDKESFEATKMKDEDKDRYGPGKWDDFVEFDEFDGGDGQMGVAGDGNKGLEKIGSDATPQLAKSKMMSAKNAWGTSTGYGDQLREQGVETSRAQQLENW